MTPPTPRPTARPAARPAAEPPPMPTEHGPTEHGPTEHDVIGIGLGPFNLGLAALLDGVDGVSATFFDARPEFSWHPGLLLDGASLQVPFLADLVTLADPTSPHSFLNYLHTHDRLYRFYFYDHAHVPRREFDRYCRWVAGRLGTCRFGHRVVGVAPLDGRHGDRAGWSVKVEGPEGAVVEHRAGAVVAGVGSRPWVPACAADHLGPEVVHSAGYVPAREQARALLAGGGRVTVIGSGQSAAEVFADLVGALPAPGSADDPAGLAWFTRSRGFFPMEYTKLGLEHFTPEYTAWFHALAEPTRDRLRAGQDLLYKGISSETSNAIYDALYERTVDHPDPGATYAAGFELVGIEPEGDRRRLHLRHVDDNAEVTHRTDLVVLATGYEPTPLPLEDPAAVARDRSGRPEVTLDYRVRLADGTASDLFVQNGELHTHGVGAPDLGLGARRNATIVNQLAGRDVYRLPERTVFQRFGAQVADDLVAGPVDGSAAS